MWLLSAPHHRGNTQAGLPKESRVLYQSIGVTPTVADMHHTPAPNESNVKAQMKVYIPAYNKLDIMAKILELLHQSLLENTLQKPVGVIPAMHLSVQAWR